jgi:hypothetical protein
MFRVRPCGNKLQMKKDEYDLSQVISSKHFHPIIFLVILRSQQYTKTLNWGFNVCQIKTLKAPIPDEKIFKILVS